jgi:hypothetical protein
MIALLALTGAILLAQSQPPSPGPRASERQQPHQQPSDTQQPAAADQRGTAASPIVVKVLPTAKTQEETAKEQAESDKQATAQWWNIAASVATVIILAVQLIIIGFQVRLASRQNQIMEGQTTIMDGQASAAQKQADYMLEGLAVTKEAADAAKASADAATRSADAGVVAAKALKVIHRQWVVVDGWACTVEPLPKTDKLWARVSVRIKNSSPLPLTIVTVRCQFNKTKGGYEWCNDVLEPGGTMTSAMHHILTDEEAGGFRSGGVAFVIAGWVHFMDAFGDLQNQAIGRHCQIGPNQRATFRGLAMLKHNLEKLVGEWPLDEDLVRGAMKDKKAEE